MAFPATPILDDFNRPDGPLGPGWDQTSGTPPIIVGGRMATGGPGSPWARWATAWSGDAEAYVTYAAITASPTDGFDLYLHAASPTGLGYDLYVTDVGGGASLYKRGVGGGAFLENYDTLQPQAGDTYLLRTVGDRVEAWRKPAHGAWAPLGPGVVDTELRTGHAFLYFDGPGGALDDFGGGVIVAPPLLDPPSCAAELVTAARAHDRPLTDTTSTSQPVTRAATGHRPVTIATTADEPLTTTRSQDTQP